MDLKTLNALPSVKAHKRARRVGRGPGSGCGKTCGRGTKGAGSRSGHRRREYYEGGQMPLVRRFPKRGFSNAKFRTRYSVLNVSDLNRFEDGETVDVERLKKAGLLKQMLDGIKILGDGELERKGLKVTAHRFSKSALAKLEAAGCEATALEAPKPRKPTRAQFEAWAKEREAAAGAKGQKKAKDAKKG